MAVKQILTYHPVNHYNGEKQYATKELYIDKDGNHGIENHLKKTKLGLYRWHEWHTFDDFSSTLTVLEKTPTCYLLMAHLKEGTDLSKLHHRRKDFEKYDIQGKGDTVVLVEGENDALHLDINKLPLALLGISEPVTMVNIKSLIRLLLNQYLPEFADAHCHYHLTSSCGWEETKTISCRLSFVLATPLTNAALKNLYLSINERAQFKLLAPAVCSASQPIFTANPIITPPAVTPFNIRSGNLYGDNEFLDLDILMLKKIRL